MPVSSEAELTERARGVRLLVLDVDGVLTDGTLYLSASGEELKAFNIQDGLGIKLLQAADIEVAIVTGRSSRALELRARELGVMRVTQDVADKLAAVTDLLEELGLAPEQAACVGDDLPDLPLLSRCGLAVAVPEAPRWLLDRAHYVTRRAGGRGAVREVCELLLRAQGALPQALERYLR